MNFHFNPPTERVYTFTREAILPPKHAKIVREVALILPRTMCLAWAELVKDWRCARV